MKFQVGDIAEYKDPFWNAAGEAAFISTFFLVTNIDDFKIYFLPFDEDEGEEDYSINWINESTKWSKAS